MNKIINNNYKLYNGDCLNVMDDLISEGVKADAIIVDIPYGTVDCKWDVIIPFDAMWERLNKIIKDNGAVCLFGSEPFSSYLRMSNIDNYKYDWIWEKSKCGCFVHAKNMPMKKHEIISVFSNGSMGHASLLGEKRMCYYPQDLIYKETKYNFNKENFNGVLGQRPSHKKKFNSYYSNYPTSILKYSNESGLHPTQKPVALMEYLIKTYTLEGETVLDFTMGSGSTGVACLNTNRKFIGIELDTKYFDIATKRIKEAEKE